MEEEINMQEASFNYYGGNKEFMKEYTHYAEFLGKVLCGFASGYAFLILFVLALDVSNMTVGRIGQIGDLVSVSFPAPFSPHRIVLWNTKVETLELAKIIVTLSLFVISSVISCTIFLQIKNIYNVLLILGLEYLPIPLIGSYLRAQGFALYFMMFIIGVCLICYSTALRTFLRNKSYELSVKSRELYDS